MISEMEVQEAAEWIFNANLQYILALECCLLTDLNLLKTNFFDFAITRISHRP